MSLADTIPSLSKIWEPIVARKGTRAGMHCVKWMGPNRDGAARLAHAACPTIAHLSCEEAPGKSAAAAGVTSSSWLSIGSSDSPVGFHVLDTAPIVVGNNAAGSGGAAQIQNSRWTALRFQMLAALLMEPGTLIWCEGPQPRRHEFLEELCRWVSFAQVVVCTGGGSSRVGGDGGASSSSSAPFLPNHLIVVPHGWPTDAPKRAEQELRDWMFKLEPAFDESNGLDQDAVERNRMRMYLESAFLSIQVYALPEVDTLQYRDRVDQLLRSRWIAGCLEGWGMTSTSGAPLKYAPVISNLDCGERLERIEKLFTVTEEVLVPPLLQSNALESWIRERVAIMVDEDFSQYCAARASRITALQARETHDVVFARCRRLCECCVDAEEGRDALLSAEAQLDSLLQKVLVDIQRVEEERRKQQAQRRDTHAITIGGLPSQHERELYFASIVVAHVPRAYWFWFTNQGMGVVCVFLTLMLYTFWPRGGR